MIKTRLCSRFAQTVTLSTPIAEPTVALSTLELPQDCRATVNQALIAAQPPSFLALESIPRLGEKSRRPSTPEIADSRPGIADRRSDCRPSTRHGAIVEEKSPNGAIALRCPLFGKRRGCRPQRRCQAQAQVEQSTHACTQGKAGPFPLVF
ncbi:hypothetical protein B296_00055925 [Ensete ventricosum]|uniref:Uncharacterized protein n=1 Tax=Ensete ventricosum TaxID=4639 RepID=A0A426WW32_ENSVE|nr:hypothetical protein B296_00055925 [Ensete ventricosum]